MGFNIAVRDDDQGSWAAKMNPFHLILIVAKVLAERDNQMTPRHRLFSFSPHFLVPIAIILPLVVISLGAASGVGWIKLLSEICAVLILVGMALWVARKLVR